MSDEPAVGRDFAYGELFHACAYLRPRDQLKYSLGEIWYVWRNAMFLSSIVLCPGRDYGYVTSPDLVPVVSD